MLSESVFKLLKQLNKIIHVKCLAHGKCSLLDIIHLAISAISRNTAILGTLNSTQPFTVMVISALYSHSHAECTRTLTQLRMSTISFRIAISKLCILEATYSSKIPNDVGPSATQVDSRNVQMLPRGGLNKFYEDPSHLSIPNPILKILASVWPVLLGS